MIAAASPTPLAAGNIDLNPRPILPQGYKRFSSRANIRRGALSAQGRVNGPLVQTWKFSAGDSSDDEMPVAPMKFSAEAKALLGDEASMVEGSSPSQRQQSQQNALSEALSAEKRRSPPLSLVAGVRERISSPTTSRLGSPRIVRLNASSTAPSTLRRSQSVRDDSGSPASNPQKDFVTPAPRTRSYSNLPPTTISGNTAVDKAYSADTNQPSAGSDHHTDPSTNSKEHSSVHDISVQMESLSITRTKGEEMGPQTAQRQKRGLKLTGRLLSGPARRGLKRRQSEEDQSPVQDIRSLSGGGSRSPREDEQQRNAPLEPPSIEAKESQNPNVQQGDTENQRPPHVRFQSQASIITGSPNEKVRVPAKNALADTIENRPPTTDTFKEVSSSGKRVQPIFKFPPLPPLPSRYDQENEPPPTFKRNKPNGVGLSDKQEKLGVLSDSKMMVATPATLSPKRPALAPRSQNTPHRPAPPPPKMTVLDTATATAGAASASQARKKRNQYMSVNGRYFTRMDCIGRGGSSKVYRVMAENYKVFALKRVTLEDQDELAVRGYKGEIDLLRRLENVDRVVRLFDYEINEEKHTLSVLMEMGESDLNRVLTQRLNSEEARLDITFTRYFWKEMLECVQSVHAYDIVHSDLKPANFLLLQGRLKLIDFGISNAIAENTVNVHREQHIGTPNYMSPEALIDSNAAAGLPATEGKMMKLGKPSDVWSLGCILYQMVYGKPPFAHIANQMQRIMAIPNPRHAIAFPDTGVGGVAIPAGLIRTLRRCLSRDPAQRSTVDEMLAFGDPFLFPDIMTNRDTVPVSQELIARLQHNIIKHVREKGIPSDAELTTWPGRFFASIKAAVEEGRA